MPSLGETMALYVQVRKNLLHFAGRLDTAAVTRAVTQSGTGITLSSESSGPLCWSAAKTTGQENRTVCVNKKKEICVPPDVLAFHLLHDLFPLLLSATAATVNIVIKCFFHARIWKKSDASSWR